MISNLSEYVEQANEALAEVKGFDSHDANLIRNLANAILELAAELKEIHAKQYREMT